MNIDVMKLSPLRDDVVLKLKPIQKATNSVIFIEEQLDHTTMQFFEVIRVGPDVKTVSVGDTVVCSWKRITEPFSATLDGVQCKVGITSEKEIDCIVDYE
jgi:co-chaperonin GroES (HSP10)